MIHSMAARGAASLLLLTGLAGAPAAALDLGPRIVPVKILGLQLPIPLTVSLDMHTEADRVAVDLKATGNLAALQAHALEIARRLPLPEDTCRHKGVNLVINSIDDAHIGAVGDTAVIDMSGHATAWACAKVLGAKVKTKLVADTVSITLPVELYTPTPRQVALRVKGEATIRTGNPDTQEAAAAILGDLNARLTAAIAKALDSEKAQAAVPDIPGLDVTIDKAVFAEDHGDLHVNAHVEGQATSEAVNGLLEMMSKKGG
ncbi:hypothetical protein [Labrys monachus]|uniref:Uncharacterized protein n=1 Tax=Labrys monachus TaxID=217067 RepID=A0ABU0FCU5_9HYPH|nr:hypothetical protein [Labrys monachus]MDQ0392428.1 hypothetical protein [Labrys monachus]